MKSKTLKQFLAEKRKTDAQHPEAIMKALDELANIHPGEYYGSAVIINITDLEGKVLADAAVNGEALDTFLPHGVEAYRQTLMAKEIHVNYTLRKMQNFINALDPEGPNQAVR